MSRWIRIVGSGADGLVCVLLLGTVVLLSARTNAGVTAESPEITRGALIDVVAVGVIATVAMRGRAGPAWRCPAEMVGCIVS